MPKGPRGKKRPADVIGNAVKVMQITTGEVGRSYPSTQPPPRLGSRGGKARARKLFLGQRAEIARKAAEKRWRRS